MGQRQQLKQSLINRRKVLQAAGINPKVRKMPIPTSTKTLENHHFQTFNFYINKILSDVKETVLPKVPEIIEQRKSELNIDAYGDIISSLFGIVRINWGSVFSEESAKGRIEETANRVNKKSESDQDRIVISTLGVNPIRNETWLQPKVESFTAENVALIKPLPDEILPEIEKIVRFGVESGESTRTIASRIFGKAKKINGIDVKTIESKAKNKAKFLARDQVSKFNSSLTELRQTSIGVERYIWRTSRDERVRGNPSGKFPNAVPSHFSLDGKEFYWSSNKPESVDGTARKPRGLNPGQDYQCRCIALPVLDDFL